MRLSRSTLLLLLALILNATLAQRLQTGLLFQYHFDKNTCRNAVTSTVFANDVSGSALGTATSMLTNSLTYACPSTVRNGITFNPSSNGITTRLDASFRGVRSSNSVPSTLTLSTFTLEFWINYQVPASGGSTTEFLLFEIAKVDTALSKTSWRPVTNFFLRLSVVGDKNLELRYPKDSSGLDSSIERTVVGGVVFATGIHHFTVVFNQGAVNNENLVLYVDSIKQVGVGVISSPAFFDASANPVVTIGSSYGVSNSLPLRNFVGDIYLAAMYTTALTQANVTANFAAQLPNSAPTAAEITNTLIEDVPVVLDLTPGIFDFDVSSFNALQTLSTTLTSLPARGSLKDGVLNPISSAALPHTIVGALTYTQATLNDDQGTDSFKFTASDGVTVSNEATLIVQYTESNDTPEGIATVFTIPEFREFIIFVSGQDLLNAGKTRPDFEPETITILQEATTTQFGVYKLKNSAGKCEDDGTNRNITFPFTTPKLSVSGTRFFFEICYAAGGDPDRVSEDGIIGTDQLNFIVTDGAGLTSQPVVSTVQVASVLTVGCGEVGERSCSMDDFQKTEEGDDFYSIQLRSVDNRCDVTGTKPDGCEARVKEIVITLPLPDPLTEGTIRAVDLAGNEVSITQAIFNLPQGFKISGDTVKFYPVKNYYNLQRHPVCVTTGTDRVLSDCAARGSSTQIVSELDLECVGAFCSANPAFTTENLNFDVIRKCSNDTQIDGGCPVEIWYRLKIGQGFSTVNSFPPQLLWIKDVADDGTTWVLEQKYTGFEARVSKIVANDKGEPIKLLAEDDDARNVQVAVQLFASAGIEDDEAFYKVNVPLGNDGFEKFNFAPDICYFSGCQKRSTIIGVPSKINKILETLEVLYNQALTGEKELTLSFQTTTPYKSAILITPAQPSLVTLVIGKKLASPSAANQTIKFVAIGAAIAITCCMCLISYLESAGKFAGRNTRMAVATWNVVHRKGAAKAIVSHKKDEAIKRTYSLASEEDEIEKEFRKRIKKKAKEVKKGSNIFLCLGAVLPCCRLSKEQKELLQERTDLKKDVELLEDGLERRMHNNFLDKRLPRRNSVIEEDQFEVAEGEDILDWERHSTVKDGKEVVYYYNKATDKSQWHSPYPGKPIKKGKPAPQPTETDNKKDSSGKAMVEKRKSPAPPMSQKKKPADSADQKPREAPTGPKSTPKSVSSNGIQSARKAPVPPKGPKKNVEDKKQDSDIDGRI